MKWMEIAVQTSHAATEAVADIFNGLGSGGVIIEDPRLLNFYINSGLWDYTDLREVPDHGISIVRAYLPLDERLSGRMDELEQLLAQVNERMKGSIDSELLFRELEEEDWSSSWKQYFHPVRVGKCIVIKPTWEDYVAKPGDLVLEIDPGMAFGTGTHHTTCLCLETLEDIIKQGQTVFDVGTGSGILSVASALLGAQKIIAVDFDDTAVKVAKENIVLNNLNDRIDVYCGDLLSNVEGTADIIVANIVASVIVELVHDIPQKLKEEGLFLTSGIIEERVEEVLQAAAKAGLALVEKRLAGGWAMLLFKKGK